MAVLNEDSLPVCYREEVQDMIDRALDGQYLALALSINETINRLRFEGDDDIANALELLQSNIESKEL